MAGLMTKVLLVEDENPNLYKQQIEVRNGFEFVVVRRGDHALMEFQKHRPDLILMDVRLPMMNGIKATRQIRRIDRSVPIIVLTAYSDRDTRQKALAAGANDFFAKPFGYQRLYERMVELTSGTIELDAHLQALITNKQRRLNALLEKQAMLGISTPVEIQLEIEDLRVELEELND